MKKTNSKVLFVVLPYIVKTDSTGAKIRSYHAFPYGVLSMASFAQYHADMKVLDLNSIDDEAYMPLAFRRDMHSFQPDIVGFSMMFDNSYKHLKPLLQTARDINPEIITLLGGAAASYSYEDILREQPDLDAVCFSEGEIPLTDIVGYTKNDVRHVLDNHQSWVTRETLADGIKPKATFVDNLDKLIDIDYAFVNTDDYEMKEAFSPYADQRSKKQFFLMSSRGCPFKCTFCSNSKIHGREVRYASVDAIIEHVKFLVGRYGMEVLTIYDDQLLLDTDRAKDLFRQLRQFSIRIECPNGLSVAFIDDELAFLMQDAGMDTIYLAIENGSPHVLNKIIKKPLKIEQIKPAVKILRQYNFFLHGFFVMGMPGETRAHRQETMDLLKEIQLDWAGLNMATPVRGSALYEQCIANGWIEKQKIEDIVDKKYIINIPGIRAQDVEDEVYDMNLEINFVNNRRMAIGDYPVAKLCFEDVLRRYNGHAFAHYYIAECKRKLNESPVENINEFQRIISTDARWEKRAKKFNLK